MPKAKKKVKGSNSRGKTKSTPKKPGKERELLFRVIDKLGASVSSFEGNKNQVNVAHFNHPPFIIDFKKMAVIDIEMPPASGEATVVQPPDAA